MELYICNVNKRQISKLNITLTTQTLNFKQLKSINVQQLSNLNNEIFRGVEIKAKEIEEQLRFHLEMPICALIMVGAFMIKWIFNN
jgi:hypothetical protein